MYIFQDSLSPLSSYTISPELTTVPLVASQCYNQFKTREHMTWIQTYDGQAPSMVMWPNFGHLARRICSFLQSSNHILQQFYWKWLVVFFLKQNCTHSKPLILFNDHGNSLTATAEKVIKLTLLWPIWHTYRASFITVTCWGLPVLSATLPLGLKRISLQAVLD